MTFTTYYLKFADEAEAQTVLATVGIYVPEIGNNPGYYKQADAGWAFDPIGTITEGGIWDQVTGDELEAPTTLEGWHANYIAAELPAELTAYALDPEPATPHRRFAGF